MDPSHSLSFLTHADSNLRTSFPKWWSSPVLQQQLLHTELSIPRHTKKQTHSKSWQKLTKEWKVLRGVYILSTSADSQVRSYQLTHLLSVANQPSFEVGINTTFLIKVSVLFTVITIAKAGGCKLNHCCQGLLYHQ